MNILSNLANKNNAEIARNIMWRNQARYSHYLNRPRWNSIGPGKFDIAPVTKGTYSPDVDFTGTKFHVAGRIFSDEEKLISSLADKFISQIEFDSYSGIDRHFCGGRNPENSVLSS